MLPTREDRVKAFFVAVPQIARNWTTHRPRNPSNLLEPDATNACMRVVLGGFGIAGFDIDQLWL
jgi:hypothetical protein